ncbi:MAG TPA: type IX secretion system sortase PorU, partial [Bacteroidota bacterium]
VDPRGLLAMTYGIFQGSAPAVASPVPLSFSFGSADRGADGYVDWLETHYLRFFSANGDYLRFWGPDTTAVVEYNLQQFSQPPMVFNVSSPADVRRLDGVAGNAVFRARESSGGRSEYVAAAPAAWRTPASIQTVQNQDLHGGLTAGADYLIITAAPFRAAADRLAAFRRQAPHGGLQTLVIDVAQIYNEFSGGLPDVSAIRDFLKYACDSWQRKPAMVLFFGGASYDYKGILGTVSSFVPTWESDESLHEFASFATDDFFAALGGGSIPWFATGRIAARTPAEAQTIVDKIIRYDDASAQDSWKMRMLFIADDAWTPGGGDSENGTAFGNYVDQVLASSAYTPDLYEKRKVYIAEYPTIFETQGRRKPGAYEDIIRYINEGVAVVNYDGHGNPQQLADESIFHVQTSIPRLTNADRLPLFYLSTCSFSQFDDPTRYSGSELLLNKADGGAIGCLSACRKVYADDYLLADVHGRTFFRGAQGRLSLERPATALFAAKVVRGNEGGDLRYFFMGDPAMRLQFPAGYASIDTINGQSVDSLGGQKRTTPIRLASLSRVTLKGAMRDARGAVDSAYQGSLSLLVNDASQWRVIQDYFPGTDWGYLVTGPAIFRGEHTVKNGRFEAHFVVPRDIAYADSNGRGRIVAYIKGSGGDGEGFSGNVAITGVDSAAAGDAQGPHIALYLNSRSFRSGDLVNSHPLLLADFSDSSGINMSKAGVGHRLEAWVNNGSASLDLTDFYTSAQDDYRRGAVQMPLTALPAGRNTIRVRAWDTFNNSAVAETWFEVASSDDALTLADVFNYPNPFSRAGTSFTFRHNQHARALQVRIRIYTVAGRLIQTLESMVQAGEPFAKIPWDGRDRDGDTLANGVYLYKLLVSTDDGLSTAEALGKLAVLR